MEHALPEDPRHHDRRRGARRSDWRRASSNIAKRTYRALDLSGYARIDIRLDDEGRPYVLEANPNPNLAYGEDFAESAEKTGVSYEALLDRIIRLGLRWEPARTGSANAMTSRRLH